MSSTLDNLPAATAATGGFYYGIQGGADRQFTATAAGATLLEAANAAAQLAAIGGAGTGANTFTGAQAISVNGAASTPPLSLTGTIFTGGTSTTTKPSFLIEPTGTTSNNWSTNGTGYGVNAPSGFTGNLVDAQVAAASKFKVDYTGRVATPGYFGVGGPALCIDGSFTHGMGASSNNGPQMYSAGQSIASFLLGGPLPNQLQVGRDATIAFRGDSAYAGNDTGSADTFLRRGGAAATIQQGNSSATPINQTFKGPNGVGTNIVGGKLCIAPGQSTGSATPAVLALQGTASGSSGTTAQTLVDVLSIVREGVIRITNIPTSSAGLSAGDVYSNAGILTIV